MTLVSCNRCKSVFADFNIGSQGLCPPCLDAYCCQLEAVKDAAEYWTDFLFIRFAKGGLPIPEEHLRSMLDQLSTALDALEPKKGQDDAK